MQFKKNNRIYFVLTSLLALCTFYADSFASAAHTEGSWSLDCPADVWVDCDAELWDLSIYGNATITAYGQTSSAGTPEWEEYFLTDCGGGTIVRTWQAVDPWGDLHTCAQTIYVGASGFDESNITWPPDYNIHSCTAETNPEDLPTPYNMPVIDDEGLSCVQIMIGFEDLDFDINPPACRKVLRTWKVINWCTYDPNGNTSVGIWEHTQIIKVIPENPPEIICPDDVTVTSGAECYNGAVNLIAATGTADCEVNAIITNNSPYAFDNGSDASGMYPVGTTVVTFTATDGCGNKTTCKTKVTVKDMKKPVPICYYGLSVSLMQMPDGYYMNLNPEWFDKGSYDNCTSHDNLIFDIEPKSVGCEDLGETPVTIYITDESGNTQYCETKVYVQDNMGMCPPMPSGIQGAVYTPSGEPIDDVQITLTGEGQAMTDDEGLFEFSDLLAGSAYELRASKDQNMAAGISTLDLIYLLKHNVGIEKLSNPYSLLAADLDQSGNLTANDLLTLRDMVLHNQMSSQAQIGWNLFPEETTFADPENPWATDFTSSFDIPALQANTNIFNFTGLKMGDLNGDAMSEEFQTDISRSGEDVELYLEPTSMNKGEQVELAFYVKNFQDIIGFQLTLEFDPLLADFQGIEAGALQVNHSNLGLSHLNEGAIMLNWFNLDATSTNKDEVLFKLIFEAQSDGWLNQNVQLSSEMLHTEGYKSDYETVNVILEGGGTLSTGVADISDPQFLSVSNRPNPFSTETDLTLALAQPGETLVNFYNLNGQLLHSFKRYLDAGDHTLSITKREIGVDQGIVMLQVFNNGHVAHTKLILF